MTRAEVELRASLADQRRLDDVAHAAALSGLTDQLTQAGDVIGTHVAAGCERQVLARLGLAAGNGAPRPGWGIEPR
jgi:hypothetical protein